MRKAKALAPPVGNAVRFPSRGLSKNARRKRGHALLLRFFVFVFLVLLLQELVAMERWEGFMDDNRRKKFEYIACIYKEDIYREIKYKVSLEWEEEFFLP